MSSTLAHALVDSALHATPPIECGFAILRYSRFLLVFGWIGCLLMLSIVTVFDFSVWERLAHAPSLLPFWILIFGPVLLYSFFSLSLVLIAHRCKLAYGESKLVYFPLVGRELRFTWTDVKKVTYSRLASRWTLHLRDRRKVPIGLQMNGTLSFLTDLQSRSGVALPTTILPDRAKLTFSVITLPNGKKVSLYQIDK